MVSSAKLALSVIIQAIRSSRLGSSLKAFVLRCLLLWPRILRCLRRVWSWYFRTSSNDGKSTKRDLDTRGPSSAGELRNRQECVVVSTSRVPVGEPGGLFMSGPSDAEPSTPMENTTRRNPSVHTLSSHAPSRQGSPRLSAPPSRRGSPNSSASSLREEYALDPMNSEWFTRRSSTPVNWTHSRAAGRQFTGVTSRSRPSSPSPFPFLRNSSRLNTPTGSVIDIPTRLSMIQNSGDSPSGSPSGIPIEIRGPSRLGTPEDTRSADSLPPESPMTSSSQSTRAFHRRPIPFPEPSISRLSTQIHVGNPPFQPGMPPVRPMHSDQVSRYVKNGDVPPEESKFWLLPMQIQLPHSYVFPNSGSWTPIIHPGGALYFYHETERIFTDVYMYDPSLREDVQMSARLLYEKLAELESRGIHFPAGDYDLVIDIVKTKDEKTVRQYYYVNHNTRTLFWLELYDMSRLLSDAQGVEEPGHIKLRLESLYWVHWSLYPVGYRGRKFPDGASKELLEILLSSSIDSLTSKVSTAPYSVADMQTMRDVIKEAKDLGSDNPHTISSLARLLSICVQWKFIHFHGQKTSRQSRYKSIFKDNGHKRTKGFRILTLVLFFTPDVHLRELKRVWADELIIEEIWRSFMQKLVSEWVEFVLYSTVMLAANVAFLAIPGVIVVPPAGSGWIKASPAQVASSMSLVFSIGSIISGLLLIRRNRTMGAQDPSTACAYLDSMTWRHFYLEPLAVIFSLTYALLMWSVCVFFVALLLFSFQNATTHIRAWVGVASGIVSVLIVCCIINSWESDGGDSEKDELIDIISEDGSHTT